MRLFSNQKYLLDFNFCQYWTGLFKIFHPEFIGYNHFSFFYIDVARISTRFPVNLEVHKINGLMSRNTWTLIICILGFELEFSLTIVSLFEEEEIPANYN
ncbi:MAG: hypothetical protein GTN99_02805 [Candidatus Dadabacteria bacterium]|nr:hypothetical protein [Candidatus Dadabacteria bacterium]